MLNIHEVIIVEGKYDRNKLSQIVNADIIETSGFGIFSNEQLQNYILRMAEKRGLLVLTDSDSAGFKIRNFIKSFVPKQYVKHAYIPDVYGKERRKKAPSKENKLGVEGMDSQVLLNALLQSGVSECSSDLKSEYMSKQKLFSLGLCGKENSSGKRRMLLNQLHLPEHLSANDLVSFLNIAVEEDEFYRLCFEAGIIDTPLNMV